ncbi:hypothetical protein SKAU_G00290180 [Synaphobranchus kaupii]|uniref:Uncharacterized protein n=1 Tax=Synaphobranchus kaupii TaxID=118154 RepID=A0A9Q1ETN0_SYNKA|nr:hypothetical protein SKAU_G00290180 [Synaphobranchus kaupii]
MNSSTRWARFSHAGTAFGLKRYPWQKWSFHSRVNEKGGFLSLYLRRLEGFAQESRQMGAGGRSPGLGIGAEVFTETLCSSFGGTATGWRSRVLIFRKGVASANR